MPKYPTKYPEHRGRTADTQKSAFDPPPKGCTCHKLPPKSGGIDRSHFCAVCQTKMKQRFGSHHEEIQMSTLLDQSIDAITQGTTFADARSSRQLDEAVDPRHINQASNILGKKWANKGSQGGFHKAFKGGNITVDYHDDKAEAHKHAADHVKHLAKRGIKATPQVNSVQVHGAKWHFHGVTVQGRTVSEDVEEVNELSKATLAAYAKRSPDSGASYETRAGMASRLGHDMKDAGQKKEAGQQFTRAGKLIIKSAKRRQGHERAIDKLAREENDLEESVAGAIKSDKAFTHLTKAGASNVRTTDDHIHYKYRGEARKIQHHYVGTGHRMVHGKELDQHLSKMSPAPK